jgi:hypothetical protein
VSKQMVRILDPSDWAGFVVESGGSAKVLGQFSFHECSLLLSLDTDSDVTFGGTEMVVSHSSADTISDRLTFTVTSRVAAKITASNRWRHL